MQLFLTNATTACSFLVNCLESAKYPCASIFNAMMNCSLTAVDPISGNPEFMSNACGEIISISRFDGFPSWEVCQLFVNCVTQQAEDTCNAIYLAGNMHSGLRTAIIIFALIMPLLYCICCCFDYKDDEITVLTVDCRGFRCAPKPRSWAEDEEKRYPCPSLGRPW